MAGAENQSGAKNGSQDTKTFRRRLDTLDGKLAKARGQRPQPVDSEGRGKAMGQALKLSTEMVASVAVGGVIGWTLDWLFDTKPILMLVFLILGGATGILNVMRTAKSMQGEPMPGHHLRTTTEREVTTNDDKD
jgi:ATP synthase protein I